MEVDVSKFYVGQDGGRYCSVCGEPKFCKINFRGKELTVGCMCKCENERLKADEDRDIADAKRQKRERCFKDKKCYEWTFDNDDKANEKVSAALRRYVKDFEEHKANGQGLLLWGRVGSGKSFLAGCVANAVIDEGYSALMTDFPTIINRLQANFDNKQEIIDMLNRYALLVIDDLGVERNSEYVREQVYNIINARYKAKLPMVITTNLPLEEIARPKDIEFARVYERILERCHPVEMNQVNRRRQGLNEKYRQMQAKLFGS